MEENLKGPFAAPLKISGLSRDFEESGKIRNFEVQAESVNVSDLIEAENEELQVQDGSRQFLETPITVKLTPSLPKAPMKQRKQVDKKILKPKKLIYHDPESEESEEDAFRNLETLKTSNSQNGSRNSKKLSVNRDYGNAGNVSARTRRTGVDGKTNSREENAASKEDGTGAAQDKENIQADADLSEMEHKHANCYQGRYNLRSNRCIRAISPKRGTSKSKAAEKNISRNLDWIHALKMLQLQRDVGLYIQCCNPSCKKWRYSNKYHDPVDVPEEWFCRMNSDEDAASCDLPGVKPSFSKNTVLLNNNFTAGSLVWAQRERSIFWPGIVDDCPVRLRFFKFKSNSKHTITEYHVTFFPADEDSEILHKWLNKRNIWPFSRFSMKDVLKRTKNSNSAYKRKNYDLGLAQACDLAKSAVPLTIFERLQRFSFLAQFERNRNLRGDNSNKTSASTSAYVDAPAAKRPKMTDFTELRRPVENSSILNSLVASDDEIIESSQPIESFKTQISISGKARKNESSTLSNRK